MEGGRFEPAGDGFAADEEVGGAASPVDHLDGAVIIDAGTDAPAGDGRPAAAGGEEE